MTMKNSPSLPLSPTRSIFLGNAKENFGFVNQAMKDSYLEYFRDLKSALDDIDLKCFTQINLFLFQAFLNGNQVFTMGNGGSGTTASHLVCDLNKGVAINHSEKFKAICLNDNLATLMAYANDTSYSDVFCEPLKNFMNPGDIVFGFSGSGNSENVLKAIDFANKNGGRTIGLAGFGGGELARKASISLVISVYDMQKCEDVHLILCHLIMQTMNNLIDLRACV